MTERRSRCRHRTADRRRRGRHLDGRGSRRPRPEQPVVASSPSSAVDFDTRGARRRRRRSRHVRRQRVRVDLGPPRRLRPRRRRRHRDHGAARISRPRRRPLVSPLTVGAPLGATAATTAAARIDGSRLHRRLQRPSRGFGLVPRARGPHADGSLNSRCGAGALRLQPRRISEKSPETFAGRPETEVALDCEQLDVHLAAVRARRDVPQRVPQGPAAPALGLILNAVSSASPSAGVADTTP